MCRQVAEVESADEVIIAHFGGIAVLFLVHCIQFTLKPFHFSVDDGEIAVAIFLQSLAMAKNAFQLKNKRRHGSIRVRPVYQPAGQQPCLRFARV